MPDPADAGEASEPSDDDPDATPNAASVVAVVVTHRPTPAATTALLDALAPQVGAVVIVDNGSPADVLAELRPELDRLGATLLELGTNVGIAAAQNTGATWALEHGAQFVLLSDQDSLPAPDMVRRLLAGLTRAGAESPDARRRPPAAVGPVVTDERNGGAPLLFADHFWGPRRATAPATDGALVDAAFLIASGCLIDSAALERVGPMNEAWFIDHIDLEWGLRARRAGYGLYGVVGARLDHSLGDRTQRVPGRTRAVHIHSAPRNYYLTRNTVLLIRSRLMPVRWRVGYAFWIAKYAAFHVLAVPPRRERLRLLVRGAADGFRGRTGPLGARRP